VNILFAVRNSMMPVPVASRPNVPMVFNRSNTEIACSNPAPSMNVFSRFYVFYCPVQVDDLRRADPRL